MSEPLTLLATLVVTATVGSSPATTTAAPLESTAIAPAASASGPSASKPSKAVLEDVRVVRDAAGMRLQVDGRDTFVFGMNWAYMPIGENYAYDFWGKPDGFIEAALAREMPLLRAMGVNVIRQYVGIPARWITYIFETYGIRTVLNHSLGRYGHSIDGVWVPTIDYSSPRHREVLKAEVLGLVEAYRGTPGLLMWLLGNENNYGLFWASAEVEDLPLDKQGDARAAYLYSLFGEVIDGIHALDSKHPVAIANGDLQFIDLIKVHCPNLDVLGSNVYRGASAGDAFQRTRDILGVPLMFTEFGSDAFDAKRAVEDDVAQAEYLRRQWEEIYLQASGKGGVGNAIGGMVFQWSDEWWKHLQESNLSVHDNTASWANAAYPSDFVDGADNMNEEWFGITAKGPTGPDGLYTVTPRTAYYVLRAGFALDPYASSTTPEAIRAHWSRLSPMENVELTAPSAVARANLRLDVMERAVVAGLRLDLNTFTTGGTNLSDAARQSTRLQHQESLYATLAVRPSADISARASVNVLGGVAENPIDEIYFENRGRAQRVMGADGRVITLRDPERLKLYQAQFEWKTSWVEIEGFYRVGHNHWAYEGDFFGFYGEAYYQHMVDMFNADAPNGVVLTGRRGLEGLKVAFGPELWWGANPALVAKYHKTMGPLTFALVHHEDLADRAGAPTSSFIPQPLIRRSSLYLAYRHDRFTLHAGALMSGSNREGRRFTSVRTADGPGYLGTEYDVFDDVVRVSDALGGRVRLMYAGDRINFYAQGGYRGLVADTGPDYAITFTGWSLKESAQGNHFHVATGATLALGDFQIAPNVLYQKPLEGPLPNIPDLFDPSSGQIYRGVRPRNQLDDPFWVRSNREMLGLELLIAYDPTPATWAWQWDSVFREDAPFAAFVDFVYRVLPTSMDSGLGVSADGIVFAFPGAPPARNLWEVRARTISKLSEKTRLVTHLYGGITQSTGDSARTVERFGGEARLVWDRLSIEGSVKLNDWGPFDYHRDFNLTFPLQLTADVSWSAQTPGWLVQAFTRLGLRAKYRTLDAFSPRLDLTTAATSGREWELMTYVQIFL